mmetsp:Transcript_29161/g.80034  ORF Transcript_29161/g.80034 Transcript_29161/m.80034 type:complete len:136 (+) Transcript_29161:99-506(+)
MDPALVEFLQPHVEKLKVWLVAEDGYGGWLDSFFRENGKYFDAFQEEHALHYKTLHVEFAAKFEAEIQGWLRDEGMTEDHLVAMFQLGRLSGDPETEAVIDTMLEVMDYNKWIQHIFEVKKRIAARKFVRVRRAA